MADALDTTLDEVNVFSLDADHAACDMHERVKFFELIQPQLNWRRATFHNLPQPFGEENERVKRSYRWTVLP